jgi:hypothetical protein
MCAASAGKRATLSAGRAAGCTVPTRPRVSGPEPPSSWFQPPNASSPTRSLAQKRAAPAEHASFLRQSPGTTDSALRPHRPSPAAGPTTSRSACFRFALSPRFGQARPPVRFVRAGGRRQHHGRVRLVHLVLIPHWRVGKGGRLRSGGDAKGRRGRLGELGTSHLRPFAARQGFEKNAHVERLAKAPYQRQVESGGERGEQQKRG